jgi:hypothetical protein
VLIALRTGSVDAKETTVHGADQSLASLDGRRLLHRAPDAAQEMGGPQRPKGALGGLGGVLQA